MSTGSDRLPAGRWVAAACLSLLPLACSEPPPACPPGGPTPETCNGIDDDCDGRTDEELELVPETCNGLDDNCDGRIDENVFGVVAGPLRWNARAMNTPGNGVIASSGSHVLIAWYIHYEEPMDVCPAWGQVCPYAGIVTDAVSELLPPTPLMPSSDGPYTTDGYFPLAAVWLDSEYAVAGQPASVDARPSLQLVGLDGLRPPARLDGPWNNPHWGSHNQVVALGWTGESLAAIHQVDPSRSGNASLVAFHSTNGAWTDGTAWMFGPGLLGVGWQGDGSGLWALGVNPLSGAGSSCWPIGSEVPAPCPYQASLVRVHGRSLLESWTLPQTGFPGLRYLPTAYNPVKNGDELVIQVIEQVRTSPPGMYQYWTVRVDVSGSAPRVLAVERQPWAALRVRGAHSSFAHSRGVSDHPNPS